MRGEYFIDTMAKDCKRATRPVPEYRCGIIAIFDKRVYPMSQIESRMPVVVLLFASVLWGVTWLPLKFLNQQGVNGNALILVAYGVVALVLLPWIVLQRRAWRGRWHLLALIALLGGYANLAFTNAMIYGDVVRAMVLFYLMPIWGVLGGRIFLHERIGMQRGFAVALALSGAYFVLGGSQAFTAPPSLVDVLAVTSGFALAMNNVTFRITAAQPVGAKVAVMFLGCATLAALAMALLHAPLPAAGMNTWLLVVLFGAVWLLVGNLGTQWAVTHMEAGRAAVLIVMELITAVISATLIGGEVLGVDEIVGGTLIVAAALIEARAPASASRHSP